jgi:hypothetical protein
MIGVNVFNEHTKRIVIPSEARTSAPSRGFQRDESFFLGAGNR